MERIVVDNGLKTYEIADSKGNVRGVITINPNDTNIFVRADEVSKKVDIALSKLEQDEQNLTDDDMIEVVKSLDLELKEAINYLFQDDNASNVVFGEQNVLNTSKGVTFIERFLSAIMPVIEKEVKKESDIVTKRVAKYTSHLK